MNKDEQNRVVAWRLKLLRQASDLPRGVAQTCRHFGLSRKTFYKWKARYRSHGEAGLCDRPRTRTTPQDSAPESSDRTVRKSVPSPIRLTRYKPSATRTTAMPPKKGGSCPKESPQRLATARDTPAPMMIGSVNTRMPKSCADRLNSPLSLMSWSRQVAGGGELPTALASPMSARW